MIAQGGGSPTTTPIFTPLHIPSICSSTRVHSAGTGECLAFYGCPATTVPPTPQGFVHVGVTGQLDASVTAAAGSLGLPLDQPSYKKGVGVGCLDTGPASIIMSCPTKQVWV